MMMKVMSLFTTRESNPSNNQSQRSHDHQDRPQTKEHQRFGNWVSTSRIEIIGKTVWLDQCYMIIVLDWYLENTPILKLLY